MKWDYFCLGERIASVSRDDLPVIGDPVTVIGRAKTLSPAEEFVFARIDAHERRAELERR